MWYTFFTFELKYRLKRPETYLFFLFILFFAVFGVEFIFQGIDLGMVKKNSPIVIAKTMGAITGLSMIIASLIMGVPVLRDFQYDVASLIYVNPIAKKHYLTGHFFGSFVILLFIFSGLFIGMVLGEHLPWIEPNEYLPFQLNNYLQPFLWVALPNLFFGACVFFISGALTKKLMVVYTQGIIIFLLFMLTKGITNETLQAVFDPFSLTTLTKATEGWSAEERNLQLIPMTGVMLFNKLLWVGLGLLVMSIGFNRFQLMVVTNSSSKKKQKEQAVIRKSKYNIPKVTPIFDIDAQISQVIHNAWFHSRSILKLPSFWTIIICCFIIIGVNSINLGTSYGVDSYPTTYLIIEELQEMSLYFFMIILVFYSGEIMWKEHDVKINFIHDATPLNPFVNLFSRFLGLQIIYIIVMLSLIIGGIIFQTINGYYQYELDVYFTGFFLEIFPFLALYTMAAIFFQSLTGNKFIGILATIVFAIFNIGLGVFGLEHVLVNFGGNSLARYSDMNGYGHFLTPYLWVKSYWMISGLLLLVIASIFLLRGNESGLLIRWRKGLRQMERSTTNFGIVCLGLFIVLGGFIFYNTNILNEFWTKNEQNTIRAGYEKELKHLEYLPQPKIIDTHLNIDLYPSEKAYEISGYYLLINASPDPIKEIHVQKLIEANVTVTDIIFNRNITIINNKHENYFYTIYELSEALQPGDSIQMTFNQVLKPNGLDANDTDTKVVQNGTFFTNDVLPSFGYRRKYELQDENDRKEFGLAPRPQKANRDDHRELVDARSGSDSDGTNLEVIISTEAHQTALTSGSLIEKWQENGRNYFHYKTNGQIINFYPFVSARYEVLKDTCIPAGNTDNSPVDLEIYYHKEHKYNLDRMLESMKLSLDYYSTHFCPYQYDELRIVEFPRYQEYAQSFPTLIPFSEALGFIMDIDDAVDVDMVFYITAHEVAHQWWGLQLEAANVQGQHMILETLAQYSAMMVLKEKYPDEKLQQFLELQKEDYEEGKLKSSKEEVPLVLVENEDYLYYNKGALAMYELQELIGEQKVNQALQNFLEDWHSFDNNGKPARYATTADLMKYLLEATPEDKKEIVTELFEGVGEVG
ncbi:ABC transporter permease/M1 family aminopeptidase [Marinigracilibium pacificum]|uniref:Peptidase M1 n=1 Tax=Marinigracilibium pacificum TaxID=2729599 RepID=A0A848IT34_9BACT|nr:M1 family aminopeptidase [Marinigracilibium pacificum]NMM47623.1 peptidase M1 [Marinigracilibium pacificum]